MLKILADAKTLHKRGKVFKSEIKFIDFHELFRIEINFDKTLWICLFMVTSVCVYGCVRTAVAMTDGTTLTKFYGSEKSMKT